MSSCDVTNVSSPQRTGSAPSLRTIPAPSEGLRVAWDQAWKWIRRSLPAFRTPSSATCES